MREAAVAVALAALALAGCLGSPAPSADTSDAPDAPTNASTSAPTEVSAPASQAHVHNLWKGRDKVTLFDNDVQVNATKTDTGGDDPLAESVGLNTCYGEDIGIDVWCIGRATFRPPKQPDAEKPIVVPPGTWAIRTTASWSDQTITGVEIDAEAANGDHVGLGWFESSGESHTVNATYFEDNRTYFPLVVSDDGHSSVSKWSFTLRAAGEFGTFLAMAKGSVHVTVEAVRMDGDLPAEPPHPDWYEDADTYHVGFEETVASNAYRVSYMGTDWVQVHLEPENPVPPGTSEVLVEVNVTNDSPMAGGPASPEVAAYYSATDDEWDERTRLEAESNEDGRRLYRIPVQETMTDSLYTCKGKNSTWSFDVYVRPQKVADEPVLGADVRGAMHFSGRLSVGVTATTTTGADPADLEVADPDTVPGCGAVHDYGDDWEYGPPD